jgi:hypothetical protein
MIVVVNGKSVGGMTSVAVDVELEQAGPDLILIVSRFKFPDVVQSTVAQSEQSYLNSFDSAINNDRQLGWTDIGASAISSNFHRVVGASQIPTIDVVCRGQSLCVKSPGSVDNSDRSIAVSPNECTYLDISQNSNSNYRKEELRKIETSSVESAEARNSGFVPIQNVKENSKGESKESIVHQKPLQNDQGMIRSISVENNPDDCSESEQDGTDDGNAWCGCVCGATHKKSQTHKEIFWIQCDACLSWYDCSSQCLGFTESQAETFLSWTCWGCPVPQSQSALSTAEVLRPGRVSISPAAADAARRNVRKGPHENSCPLNENNGTEGDTDERVEVFSTGDLVYVTEHGWVGVNNPDGVAKVLNAHLDEDGDQVYDLKYVVGPKVNGVLPEYLRRHTFD